MGSLDALRQGRRRLRQRPLQYRRCLHDVRFDGVETRLGWTAGVGVEWALWDDWSVKLEYDYYGFGTRNVTFVEQSAAFPSGPENIKQTIQAIKLGLNFHVSAGP